MASSWHKYHETDVYVLELMGNMIIPREIGQLEKNVSEIIADQAITKLIVHEAGNNLRINSIGLGNIVRLCKAFDSGNTVRRINFAYHTDQFKGQIQMLKLDARYSLHPSLEDAVHSYTSKQ